MGNKNDGKQHNEYKPIDTKVYVKEDDVQKFGNADVKILSKAYDEYSKDGLTAKEISTLKKMDEVLAGAEFATISKNSALIVQDNGDCFGVLSETLKNHSQKYNGKNR